MSASDLRPTLKHIAQKLGVSPATVSLALRGHPRISESTRQAVAKAALALGYRPDPELAKLMTRLRTGRAPVFKSTLHALTTTPASQRPKYVDNLIEGARTGANQLGYGLEVHCVNERRLSGSRLQQILNSRGAEGILLLPMLSPVEWEDLIDWEKFAVVSATYGVLSPQCDRVIPDQFGNVQTLCRELLHLGRQRIGLILPRELDLAVNHAFSGAVLTFQLFENMPALAPYLYEITATLKSLKRWLKQKRPDALIIGGVFPNNQMPAEIKRYVSSSHTLVVHTSLPSDSLLTGIDELPTRIGAAAVEMLAMKIQTGKTGISTSPMVTMIRGRWLPGESHTKRRLSG